jgi:anti-sigma regulatory factor (Ser/Thr protein kinase)
VAAALQRVLLPASLPKMDAWALATLYEPAGEAVLVGGDFYDWFTLPNGRVLFFVGDVSGKGPLAGALGMSIRKALKGITWVVGDPLESLPLLEQALADEFADAFATLCMIEITPGSGRMRLLLAGHPRPWWRRAGVFEEVVAPANGLVGPGLQQQWTSTELELGPGDLLVLFTDGLTEARLPDGTMFGDGPWSTFLASLPPELASYEMVLQTDAHLRRVTRELSDDMIIGVMTFQPSAPAAARADARAETLTLRLGPHSTSAAAGRRFVVDACRRWHLAPEDEFTAESVTSELVTNAILHARSDLELQVSHEDHLLRLAVRDSSPRLPVFPTSTPEAPDTELEHGRGLHLVRLLGAHLGVDPLPGGKTVWATLPLRTTTPTSP